MTSTDLVQRVKRFGKRLLVPLAERLVAGREVAAIRVVTGQPRLARPVGAALRLNGEAAMARGDHQAAETALRSAVALSPTDVRAWRRLVACLVELGQFGAAGDILEQARGRFPDDPAFLAFEGLLQHKWRRYEEAVRLLSAATAHPDAEPRWQRWYAVALADVGRQSEALAVIELLIDQAPDGLRPHRQAAETAFEMGRLQEAVSYYLDELRLHPKDVAARLGLARTYRTLGAHDRSREVLEAIPGVRAVDPDVLRAVAEFHARAGDLPSALVLAERLVAITGAAEARVLLADLLQRFKRLDEAAAVLRQLLSEDGTNGDAHGLLGTVLEKQFRFDEAFDAYQRALETEPARQVWRLALAVIALRRGNLSRAETELQTVLDLNPGQAQALERLAYVRWRQGDRGEAERLTARTRLDVDGVFRSFAFQLDAGQEAEAFAFLQRQHRHLLTEAGAAGAP